jgi:hypothetical protein
MSDDDVTDPPAPEVDVAEAHAPADASVRARESLSTDEVCMCTVEKVGVMAG